jgi:hypothetical protein
VVKSFKYLKYKKLYLEYPGLPKGIHKVQFLVLQVFENFIECTEGINIYTKGTVYLMYTVPHV